MLWTILVIILILWLVGFLGEGWRWPGSPAAGHRADRADHSARNRPARGLAAQFLEPTPILSRSFTTGLRLPF